MNIQFQLVVVTTPGKGQKYSLNMKDSHIMGIKMVFYI